MSVDRDTAEATLRRLIVEHAGVPEQIIAPESSFDGDLLMDSMSFVSLQVELEAELGISVSLEELREARTVGGVTDLLEEKIRERQA